MSPHEGHLAFVEDPLKQQFIHCYIKYRKSQGKLPNDNVITGECA